MKTIRGSIDSYTEVNLKPPMLTDRWECTAFFCSTVYRNRFFGLSGCCRIRSNTSLVQGYSSFNQGYGSHDFYQDPTVKKKPDQFGQWILREKFNSRRISSLEVQTGSGFDQIFKTGFGPDNIYRTGSDLISKTGSGSDQNTRIRHLRLSATATLQVSFLM